MWYCPINKKYTKEAYTMTDKTKRIILIAVCCLLCIAAAVGIAVRFGGNADISSGVVSSTITPLSMKIIRLDTLFYQASYFIYHPFVQTLTQAAGYLRTA